MDCNWGKFFNSNSPKSLKLYLPISIDSNDSQFNTWKEFGKLIKYFHSQLPSFSEVNEFSPIFTCSRLFIPLISKVTTSRKQLFPISNFFNESKFFIQNTWEFLNAQLPIVIDCKLGKSNHYTNIISLPSIINEQKQKLYTCVINGDFICWYFIIVYFLESDSSTSLFITMNDSCGRFFNSNSPPKSLKL